MKKYYVLLVMAVLAMACAKDRMPDPEAVGDTPAYKPKSEMQIVQELATVVPTLYGDGVGTRSSESTVITDIVPFGELMLARAQQTSANASSPQRAMSNGLQHPFSTPRLSVESTW